MAAKHATVDDYLAAQSDANRSALEKVRKAIKAAAPGAEEFISYHLPSYRHARHLLIHFGAAAKHCALYGVTDAMIAACKNDLDAYDVGTKGTIRFPADKPPPATLVRKLIKARLAENAASAKKK